MLSLLSFKRGVTNDPNGALASWNSSTHFCMWKGVFCSRKHPGRVTALELTGQNLQGEISPSIGNLTFLRTLNLSTNSFSGRLSPLSRLGRLEILDLSNNSLQDTIPGALTNWSNLRILDLSMNSLAGENAFRGQVPHSLGNLQQLIRLNLSHNNLHGDIPSTLGNLQNLGILDLSHNNLDSGIPSNLGNAQSLWHLDLSDNNILGIIP
ncbi:hypothetical protein EJB05_20833, partial [Eragrostis curvula]